MSVLPVTDDADDDIQSYSITHSEDNSYKQLKELEYDFSSSIRTFFIVESTSSILVQSNKHYRQHRRRRRRCRLQPCLVQHLLTYMLTLLILTNHLHWPVIILSLSSIKIMSTHASTTTTRIERPLSTPSTRGTILSAEDNQQCLLTNTSQIVRICSKTCQTRKTPYEKFDNYNPFLSNRDVSPFCSEVFNQTILQENFFNESTEDECQTTLQSILEYDREAKIATDSFATYMQAIDSASKENRYSIIMADCQVNFSFLKLFAFY